MLPGDFQLPAGVLLLVVGLVACFAGYRLFRAVLAIYGFLLGAFFTSTVVAPSDTLGMLVALAVGGLLGALVLYAGYFVGVGLVGAGLGATVSHSVWLQWYGRDPGWLVVLFFAALGAAIGLTLQRVVVIVSTAFLGSQTAVAGVLALVARRPVRRAGIEDVWIGHLGIPAYGQRWAFLAWVLLGAVGTVVQLRAGGTRKPRARK